jgi:hypothetical protein
MTKRYRISQFGKPRCKNSPCSLSFKYPVPEMPKSIPLRDQHPSPHGTEIFWAFSRNLDHFPSVLLDERSYSFQEFSFHDCWRLFTLGLPVTKSPKCGSNSFETSMSPLFSTIMRIKPLAPPFESDDYQSLVLDLTAHILFPMHVSLIQRLLGHFAPDPMSGA